MNEWKFNELIIWGTYFLSYFGSSMLSKKRYKRLILSQVEILSEILCNIAKLEEVNWLKVLHLINDLEERGNWHIIASRNYLHIKTIAEMSEIKLFVSFSSLERESANIRVFATKNSVHKNCESLMNDVGKFLWMKFLREWQKNGK